MVTMTLRVNDKDAELVRRYADFEGKTISDFIRDAIFEKIEDAHDIASLRKAIAEDDGTRYTLDEVEKMLSL
ncbi:type II toxin-antitoxin system RelB family antitoxin [Arcanobacterium canis]